MFLQLGDMKALIGYFDLDPNRVFSLVLDAATCQPGNDAFLLLTPAFRWGQGGGPVAMGGAALILRLQAHSVAGVFSTQLVPTR